MNLQTAKIEEICSHRSDIAAYIDGELSSREELELEMHLAVCNDCSNELNEQKKLLLALNYALENEREIELPANFTKVVVANAEGKVSGLRRPQERSKALFICVTLFLLAVVGLGGEIKAILWTFGKLADQVLAVGGFVWNFVYDVAIGTAIILRSLSHQIVFNSTVALVIPVVFIFISAIMLSRVVRSNRS